MVEKSYGNLIPHLSTAKSPQAMMGTVIKTYFAQKHGVTAQDVLSCSLMPCVRKQGEADRPWHETDGSRDVDHVFLTTELAAVCKVGGSVWRGHCACVAWALCLCGVGCEMLKRVRRCVVCDVCTAIVV